MASTQKFSISILSVSVIFFVLAIAEVNSQKTVSFDFPKFTSDQSGITIQGNAEIFPNGILALTNPADPKWTTGRVLYATPVPIWDSTSGHVASFVASFSFSVEDFRGYKPADGIIFFLAPSDTVIPSNSAGGQLGVVDANNAFNRFVGVEFDNFVNQWDPNYAHIGIDVNSLISTKTTTWNRVSGSLVKVNIIYDSLSNTLSVAATNDNGQISTIAQVVDLKAMLPENVKVGISATTADGRQMQHIHSWSFTSTLA
ncbi:putative bark agglutinin LECRPA3 [Cicer arietinum]|uniref:Bark agglutinin LECRPA3 n=1 Tax=Cicer arietinum TaxID=3827 RepID=A0A1S2Z4A6_CICAR|nr:putative bark agglutinin LECRPA3 [Cicer arietinum]